MNEAHFYEIWIWADDWEIATTHIGSAFATSFKEACDNFALVDKEFARLYNADNLTYWGCKLHDRKPRLV